MAQFNGSDGSVTIETASGGGGDTILLHITSWAFDMVRRENDVTEFDTVSGWDATLPGTTKISGSLEGMYQDAAEDPLDAAHIVAKNIHLVLKADANRTFTFANGVNLTNLSFQNELGVPSRWTAAFSSSVKPAIA